MSTPSASYQTVVIPASQEHTASVIFVHGLGQNTFTWRLMVIEALVPKLPNVQFILPQAPDRLVTFNQARSRPSWFDIATLPPGDDEFDEPAIAESIGVIENLILSEVHRGIDSRRIILGGFSQGAALSLMVALSTLHEIAGVFSLSGWIPARAREQMITSPNLPIFWCHGTADIEIPIGVGENAVSFLRTHVREAEVQYRSYPGLEHTINDDEVDDLAAWLVERIGRGSSVAE
ncbi:Phospholipase/carboxylesterase/thioesterase [Mycena rebaudengoi]|nr:Phospholipase/carboxylesterase/thioesterase [Mycena rebaudengoi]